FNKVPCDSFEWEGIDGSRVLAHFIPSCDYKKDSGAERPSHFTTYNATLGPSQVMGGWQRYQQKYLNDEALMSFGFGDGGGGPTYEMLEAHRRLARGIPGCPRTEMSTSLAFYKRLEADVTGNKYLPVWSGELYLEYHRGTYTSMARNKKYNRKSEFALQNAERFAVLSQALAGSAYPKAELAGLWEILMRNQFHDILPGSSIKEVYEDSKAEYEQLNAEVTQLSAKSLEAITAQIDAASGSVVVYTPGSFPQGALVTFAYPGPVLHGLRDNGLIHPCQRCADGRYVAFLPCLSANGYAVFQPVFEACPPCDAPVVDGPLLENRFFRIVLGEDGSFLSVYDKRARRELVSAGSRANQLVVYEDKPHRHDAWDINHYYLEKSWTLCEPAQISIEEQGPVRCVVKVERGYLASRIVQRVILYRDVPRIDIACEIDWHEKPCSRWTSAPPRRRMRSSTETSSVPRTTTRAGTSRALRSAITSGWMSARTGTARACSTTASSARMCTTASLG
ncbi:MAG TPA: glycoside hydrolase family 38 C-terminal domain-containing protein, partial [Clostridia bacterium]|nr:glycoside hydrolase family 38 C-terminal domain-containing protein [Clostridia bacterium]